MARQLTLALALALLTMPALAGAELYRYETESGVVAFTDDAKRIPERYAEKAVKLQDQPLEEYSRMTISEPGASIESAKTTIDLEALDAELKAERQGKGQGSAGPASQASSDRVSIRVGGGIRLDVDADSEEPIYVDRNQYRLRNGILSPHTVVTRGGVELIVIEDRP